MLKPPPGGIAIRRVCWCVRSVILCCSRILENGWNLGDKGSIPMEHVQELLGVWEIEWSSDQLAYVT